MSRLIVAVALVLFALGAARWFVPSLTLQRPDIVATPSLDGKDVRAGVPLKAGQTACIRPLPLDPGVREVRLLLQAKRSVPLRMVASAPGYRATGRFANYAPGDAVPVTARLSGASPRAQDGQICVRNEGRGPVGLVGTSEPESLSIPVTYVEGRAAGDVDPAVTFFSGRSHSILQQAGTVLGRAAGFTGALPTWLLWPLGLLFLLGLPAGAALALALAARPGADDRRAPAAGPAPPPRR
jgi:hypothetical protein